MGIKLIASDMDGTLLTNDRKITERTVATLNRLNEQGVIFCLSSGRPPIGMIPFVKRIGFDLPLITFNGAEIIPSLGAKPIYENVLDSESANEAFFLGHDMCGASVAWESNRLILSADNAATREYHSMSRSEILYQEDVVLSTLALRKVLWIGPDPETTEQWRVDMSKRFEGRMNVYTSGPCLLEFVNHDVSKGTALKKLCEYYGFDIADSVAFGDGYNDLPMLKAAGISVAMGNAKEDIKAICTDVTLSNMQDGVADYIERKILR